MPVEKFAEKKEAFDEGLNRVAQCRKVLNSRIGDNSTINLVGGSIEEPVSMIGIDGVLDVKSLPILYKILTGEKL